MANEFLVLTIEGLLVWTDAAGAITILSSNVSASLNSIFIYWLALYEVSITSARELLRTE